MADDADPESKTEDPTERRRQEARDQGQIPFSAEMVGAILLLVGVIGLSSLGTAIGEGMLDVFRQDLRTTYKPNFSTSSAYHLIVSVVVRMLAVLLPMFGLLMLIGISASVLQVGFQINPDRLELKLDRLNPASGFGRLFSLQSVVKAVLTIAKLLALAAIAYVVLDGRIGVIAGLHRETVSGAVVTSWGLVSRLAVSLSAAIAVVTIGDYLYQRYKFEKSIRMTKQEVKDEHKREEGDPEVKAKRRQIAREIVQRKMLAEVPKATVIITNPTHIAIALRYEEATDAAPVVVAKGVGPLAEVILKLARENSVPIVERREVAQVLYRLVKEGRPIPFALFAVVATIIAFVRKMQNSGITKASQ